MWEQPQVTSRQLQATTGLNCVLAKESSPNRLHSGLLWLAPPCLHPGRLAPPCHWSLADSKMPRSNKPEAKQLRRITNPENFLIPE